MGRGAGVAELVERARQGDPRAVARLVSLVEDAAPELAEVMALLAPSTGHARVVGVGRPRAPRGWSVRQVEHASVKDVVPAPAGVVRRGPASW